jgi:hypothetical protein
MSSLLLRLLGRSPVSPLEFGDRERVSHVRVLLLSRVVVKVFMTATVLPDSTSMLNRGVSWLPALKFCARPSDTFIQRVRLDRWRDVGRGSNTRIFDNKRAFMLDIKNFSPIIYIWYEGGWLSPPVVTVTLAVGG